MAKYTQIAESEVPETTNFDVPARHQGQIVEVAYGQPSGSGSEADDGDPYKRITDRSTGEVTYYRLVQ